MTTPQIITRAPDRDSVGFELAWFDAGTGRFVHYDFPAGALTFARASTLAQEKERNANAQEQSQHGEHFGRVCRVVPARSGTPAYR